MSELNPLVSARPAYPPTGPHEEYRGERSVYRQDVGPRGGAAPGGALASSCEPVLALSAELSTHRFPTLTLRGAA